MKIKVKVGIGVKKRLLFRHKSVVIEAHMKIKLENH